MNADVVIIGAGPAGIQAAIHASRKKVSVVMFGRIDGSAMHGTHVENYFGFIGMTEGDDMLEAGLEQAKSFGCIHRNCNVTSTEKIDGGFRISDEEGETVDCKAVVIATGISRAKLNVPGEKELFGKGVSYCASCDCNFYKGRIVTIVGDDTEAAISAELMTRYASKTYWVHGALKASERLVQKAKDAGVESMEDSIASIDGDGKVQTVTLSSGRVIQTDGVFIELGAKSAVDLAMDMDVMPEMDDTLKVGRDCSTGVRGVFACGDVTGKPWQVAKAVGEGAVAGIFAANFVKET